MAGHPTESYIRLAVGAACRGGSGVVKHTVGRSGAFGLPRGGPYSYGDAALHGLREFVGLAVEVAGYPVAGGQKRSRLRVPLAAFTRREAGEAALDFRAGTYRFDFYTIR